MYEQLNKIQGVDIYRHKDIPEHLHYKNHKFIHEIILKAKPGVYIEIISVILQNFKIFISHYTQNNTHKLFNRIKSLKEITIEHRVKQIIKLLERKL